MTFGSVSSQTVLWDKSVDEGGGRGEVGWEHYQTKLRLRLRLRQLKQLGWDGANGRLKQGRQLLRAMPELSRPRVRVGSGSGFGQTWLQRVGHCADSSFMSGFLVAATGSSRGAMVRGAEGQEGYECRVDNISWRCYSITKLIYFWALLGLLYIMADYRAGRKTTWTTRGHVYHDTLACIYGCA